MNVEVKDEFVTKIILILAQVLELDSSPTKVTRETALIGKLPGFDSHSVVTLIMELEDEFEIEFEDDEVSAALFETVGSLSEFVWRKQNGAV